MKKTSVILRGINALILRPLRVYGMTEDESSCIPVSFICVACFELEYLSQSSIRPRRPDGLSPWDYFNLLGEIAGQTSIGSLPHNSGPSAASRRRGANREVVTREGTHAAETSRDLVCVSAALPPPSTLPLNRHTLGGEGGSSRDSSRSSGSRGGNRGRRSGGGSSC